MNTWQVFGSLVLVFLVSGTALADTPYGKKLLEEYEIDREEIQELESGEVVTKLAPEFEQSPRELAIDATVIIRKPLQQLVAEAEDDLTLVPGKLILDSGEIRSEADFAGVEFTPEEAEEATLWLNAKPGDDLNLGRQDLEIIARVKAGHDGRTDVELGSEAVRQVLLHRFRQYMEGGLAAIEPYARKRNKTVSAGAELRLSNEQLFGIEQYFPIYFNTLVNFPTGADCCEHRFIWMKAKVRSRPTFILIHRIILDQERASLLTERHFYVSHSLNSLQLTLGWLPWEESEENTYFGIVTSANSDYLTGFVGKMIRVVGANKGAEMVGDVLIEIRDDLEAGVDPTAKYED